MVMVKNAFAGLKVFSVGPQSGTITEVTVESAYRAGRPYYESRLRVRSPTGGLWDIFASTAFRRRQDAEKEALRVLSGA
jgi:hypothetical protein